jgi:hypothetical protein
MVVILIDYATSYLMPTNSNELVLTEVFRRLTAVLCATYNPQNLGITPPNNDATENGKTMYSKSLVLTGTETDEPKRKAFKIPRLLSVSALSVPSKTSKFFVASEVSAP